MTGCFKNQVERKIVCDALMHARLSGEWQQPTGFSRSCLLTGVAIGLSNWLTPGSSNCVFRLMGYVDTDHSD